MPLQFTSLSASSRSTVFHVLFVPPLFVWQYAVTRHL